MNQGRIWCVVNPTVGLPLFLGSIAVTSLAVHASVLTHTDWMANFFNGGKKETASVETGAPVVATATSSRALTVNVTPVADAKGGASFVISVAPNAMATAAIDGSTSTN